MPVPEFDGLPLWANLLVFAGAAAVVWLAGTRLSTCAELIASRTGLGQAFVGALLLGGITSLPEGATTVSASAIGNAPLAVNNLFGGVAMQVAILALADAYLGRRAISALVRQPAVLLQGVVVILMLALATLGMVVGEVPVLGVGVWSGLVFVTAILAFSLVHHHRQRDTWKAEGADRGAQAAPADEASATENGTASSLPRAVVYTVVSGVLILAAGFVLARVGDVLAEQTGLGAGFVGAVLVAISTSLPEVSTTLGAVRLGAHAMAFSGIFGTNVLDVAILFLADVVYTGGPVLDEVGRFSIAAAMLGVLLTAIYVVGLLERRDTVVWRLGIDSWLVLGGYVAGLAVLYSVR